MRAQLDHRVGVQVRTRPAAPQRVALGAEERGGVGHADVHVALGVERRRVPLAAAGVDRRVPPQVLYLVPAPLGCTGRGVQRPQGGLAAAEVLAHRRVDRHGGYVDGAVVVARGHVDALVVVADHRPAPQLAAGRGVQRERGVVRGPVDHPADHVDPVRAAVGRVVGVRPEHLPGGQADRHHVGLQVLDVDHAVHDHWGGGVGAVAVRDVGMERNRPGHTQLRDVRAGDRAGHVARVGQVGAGERPARGGLSGRGDRAARGDRLPGLAGAGRMWPRSCRCFRSR